MFPASGNRNGTSLNNRGSNGNYWSSSLNSSANGYNMNFNSGGVNPANNNNRFNGFSVRAVQHLSTNKQQPLFDTALEVTGYKLTRQQLLFDLYIAFYDAARHKHKMSYVCHFENHLKENLDILCDDLLTRRYVAQPSKCFVIDYPKKREVFAAMFRDRVVHHLYFNYTHQMFERTFIADSYSCIQGRGTHYGISRIRDHIRKESQNWNLPCYAMNLDIRGYFMHIQRNRLLNIAKESLEKMSTHKVGMCDDVSIPSGVLLTPSTSWRDIRDMDFILWITEQIVMLDPKTSCEIAGDKSDWDGLDRNKSLFWTADGCGLPIGNLTSQLYSNVYLNIFDQWVKRELGCRHYGRYVDDSTMIDSSREWLLEQVPKIREFLFDELGLELHMGKLKIRDVRHGVEFLGAFVKPYRDYISNKTLSRIRKNLQELDLQDIRHAHSSVNSYLGVLSHHASYNIRHALFDESNIAKILEFDGDILISKPQRRKHR